jgi:carboxypeptidase Taq
LDGYDPGLRQAKIDPLLRNLRNALPDLILRVRDRQKTLPPLQPLEGPFPIETQRRIGETLMKVAGFDFHRGRLDLSLHPFCGGSTNDIRITTRYDENDFTSA